MGQTQILENYRGYILAQTKGENTIRIFAQDDTLFKNELGGFLSATKARLKVDALVMNETAQKKFGNMPNVHFVSADLGGNTEPKQGSPAPTENPEKSETLIQVKPIQADVEKIREKIQDLDALFISRDIAKDTFRKLQLAKNKDKEQGAILVQFVNPNAPDTDKTVTFKLHAPELLEKAIEIALQSLANIEQAIITHNSK